MKQTIVILAAPGVQLLDVSGPLDVFAEANRVLRREVYLPRLMALEGCIVQASSGVKIVADWPTDVAQAPDTFLVAGAPQAGEITFTETQRETVRALCLGSQRYGSVCTGALLLAQTGLLDGRRATTHWAAAALLAERCPQTQVDADALYVADGPLRTAAGVTSGLDLALRLVEEDLGREVAMEVASNLVMFFRRPVNQGHYVHRQQPTLAGRTALQDLQRWASANLDALQGLAEMAQRMNISPRHLGRLFRQALGMGPGEWLEGERIAKARRLLEEERLPMKRIAAACGYASCDVMRRAFVKRTGMTPSVYRKIYRKTAIQDQRESAPGG